MNREEHYRQIAIDLREHGIDNFTYYIANKEFIDLFIEVLGDEYQVTQLPSDNLIEGFPFTVIRIPFFL